MGLALVSMAGRILQANPALSRIVGYAAKELDGASFAAIVREPDGLWSLMQSCLSGERSGFELEKHYLRPDTRLVWIRITVRVVRTDEGAPGHLVAMIVDVDERHAAAERLAASKARFSAMVQHSKDLIALIDDRGRVMYASPALPAVLGRQPEERIGRSFHAYVHPEDLGRLRREVAPTVVAELGASARVEFRYRHADGSWRWLEATITNQLANPAVSGYVVNARDVTDRVVALEWAAHQAAHDALTGLPNRALLEDRMSQAMNAAMRNGHQLAALFVDLDHFKSINDTLGHGAGDELLTQAADRLQDLMRAADTVTRLGGDEFVVMGIVADEAAAAALADRVCEAFSSPFDIKGRAVSLTVSVGVSTTGERTSHVGLLDEADAAVYKAKALGRNRWAAHTRGSDSPRLPQRGARMSAWELPPRPDGAVWAGSPE